MEIVVVVAVVVVLAVVQVRRRGSRLQRPDDPRAGVDGPPATGEGERRPNGG